MTKRLKLRIVKLERMLVFEQLENTVLTQLNEKTEHFKVLFDMYVFYDRIAFICRNQRGADVKNFPDNEKRDEYLKKMLGWITDELFGGGKGELKIGEMCEVSDGSEHWVKRVYAGRSAPEFGTEQPFLAQSLLDADIFKSWKYARPIAKSPLTINGEYYTWEAV